MFSTRGGSMSPMRISQGTSPTANVDSAPRSNFFGGTSANTNQMMQTKTNEQKLRVVQSNRLGASPLQSPVGIKENSATIGMSRTGMNFTTMRNPQIGNLNSTAQCWGGATQPSGALNLGQSSGQQNSRVIQKKNAMTGETRNQLSPATRQQFIDPVPPKLTNDSAEFSFRQLALARMKLQGSDDQGNRRRASIDMTRSNRADYSNVASRHHPNQLLTQARGKSGAQAKRHQHHSSFDHQARRQTISGNQLDPSQEKRLTETLQKAIENPNSRVYQPTYTGFLADQMSPQKSGFDNKPTVVNSVTRVPGQIGWGIERKHLKAEAKIITDDMRVPTYPIQKGHLAELDHHKTAQFTRYEGDRAKQIDKKLGIDYQVYNALNMQAQKATLKYLDSQRKINSTLPNRASGLGKVDAMNQKLNPSTMNSMQSHQHIKTKEDISPAAALATRASFGVSTSATESKGAFRQMSQVKSIEAAAKNQKVDFGKLVNSIMSNPFTGSTGLNSQAMMKATQRPGAHSQTRQKFCKPCRENGTRFRKTSNLDRYR